MSIQTFAASFSDWSDLISLALVAFTAMVNGLDPVFPLWGSPFLRSTFHFLTMLTLVAFSLFRFILEGVHSAIGPREFLAVSVVYFARWLYLYYTFRRSTAFPCRIFKSAQALCNLKTLRYGSSTDPDRRGTPEIVLRAGARKAKGGDYYWRGMVQEKTQHGRGWKVHLVEEGMNNDLLSVMGTTEYAASQKQSLIDFYGRVYQTVMNVEGATESHVDWSEFLTKYSAIAKTNMAVRANATGDGDLAGVARRVAADACLYVDGKYPSRTDEQIELINTCLHKAADRLATELEEENGNDD